MGEWILPFQGRGSSATYQLNFLWRSGRLYVMDNHRAALWCWWQHLAESRQWQLLHVDHHYDALRGDRGHLKRWLRHLPDQSATLDHYLSRTYDVGGGTMCPVIRWDNYVSIFLATHGDRVAHALFATAGKGHKPRHPTARTRHLSPWEALETLEHVATGDTRLTGVPWLVNLDLDYFTAPSFEGHGRFRLFEDAYIAAVGRTVAAGLRDGHIGCATLALSPETTGGWPLADKLMRAVLAPWGDAPALPST